MSEVNQENIELIITKEKVLSLNKTTLTTSQLKEVIDLRIRPQILVNDNTNLLAVFLDKDSYEGIIKMIKTLKGGEDFGIIEIAKLWKQLKPFLEKMEIKTS